MPWCATTESMLRSMTQQPSPLHIATMSQHLSKAASPGDASAFNKIALACMVTVALGSLIQTMTPLLRELNRRHDERQPSGRGR